MAAGWNRVDLEGLQPVDPTPGHMLHPAHLHYGQLHRDPISANTGDGGNQQYHRFHDDSPLARPSPKVSTPEPEEVPGDTNLNVNHRGKTPASDARILGLRRTTFFLTVSNILLAIGLVVLGVVQSQLRQSRDISTASTAQSSCSSDSTTPTGTSTAPTVLPTCVAEAGKICFASDKSSTTAIVLGDVKSECPLPEDRTNYTVPGTDLKFMRSCGTDQVGVDMGTFPVLSMFDCIALCAQLNLYPSSAEGRCTGVTWVYGDGAQGKGISFCYPKTSLREVQKRAGTESAVLVVD